MKRTTETSEQYWRRIKQEIDRDNKIIPSCFTWAWWRWYSGHYDPVLQYMRKYNIPITRETYIALYYMDLMPEVWTEEHEEQFPPMIRYMEEQSDD